MAATSRFGISLKQLRDLMEYRGAEGVQKLNEELGGVKGLIAKLNTSETNGKKSFIITNTQSVWQSHTQFFSWSRKNWKSWFVNSVPLSVRIFSAIIYAAICDWIQYELRWVIIVSFRIIFLFEELIEYYWYESWSESVDESLLPWSSIRLGFTSVLCTTWSTFCGSISAALCSNSILFSKLNGWRHADRPKKL